MARSQTEKWAHRLLCIVLGGMLGYLGLRYLLPVLLPFLVAWGVAACITPLSDRIARRWHLSPKLCGVLMLLLVLALGVWLVCLGAGRLIEELKRLFERTVAEYGSVEAMLSAWMGEVESLLGGLGLTEEPLSARLSEMLSGMLSSLLSTVAGALPVLAGRLLSALPSLLFSSVISVIAAFYFCVDRSLPWRAIGTLFPQWSRETLPRWRARARRMSLRYVKCYLLLMLLTFAILFVGFLALGVPYPLLLALLSALVDLLPILGVGTVLLPWAAVLLLQRNFFLGFGLLILYAVCTLARQIAEPRLLGKSLGLHPLWTILATYVGWRLLGILGMLLAPFFALLVKALCTQLLVSPQTKIDKMPDL